jgi:hypothetical protein
VCSRWWKDSFIITPHRLPTNWRETTRDIPTVAALAEDLLGMAHLKATSPLVVELEQLLRDADEDVDAQLLLLLAKVFPEQTSRETVALAARDLHIAHLLRWRWTPPSVKRHEAALRLAVHTTTNATDMAGSIPMLPEMRDDHKLWFFAALPTPTPTPAKGGSSSSKRQRTQ